MDLPTVIIVVLAIICIIVGIIFVKTGNKA